MDNRTWQLVRLDRESGPLHGLLTGAATGPLALHLHGTWGNFYENEIATAFAPNYVERGYRFATVNLPGHDGESMTESFEASMSAIDDWVKYLTPNGGPLIIQAHSLGALKCIRYLASQPSITDQLRGVVLLAPFDIRAFYAQSADPQVKREKLNAAETLVTEGAGRALVPHDLFSIWPIDTITYRDALRPAGTLDVFPTSEGRVGSLSDIPTPVLVAVGGDDFSASPSPEAVIESVRSSGAVKEAALVAGAPHNFAGHIDELGGLLDRFLSSLG